MSESRSFWRAWLIWCTLVSLGVICIASCHGGEIPALSDRLQAATTAPVEWDDASPEDAIWAALERLPEPEIAFGDIGVGDGRVLIAAWRKWGKPVIGYEIDGVRASEAYEACEAAGVKDFKIIVCDATKLTKLDCDVAYAYQFHDVLEQLKDLLMTTRAFVTYAHTVPGLPMEAGPKQTFVWRRDAQAAVPDVAPAVDQAVEQSVDQTPEPQVEATTQAPHLYFYEADWCGACKQMHDDIAQLEAEGYVVEQIQATIGQRARNGVRIDSLPFTQTASGTYWVGAVRASDIRPYLRRSSSQSSTTATSTKTDYWAEYGGKMYSASAWGEHAKSCNSSMCRSLCRQWRAAGWDG